MAEPRVLWTRDEVEKVMTFYLITPFGKLHKNNPDVIRIASLIGRTPSAVAWKLVNLAACDPEIVASGRSGASNCSDLDREVFLAYLADPENALAHVDDEFWKTKEDSEEQSRPPALRVGHDIIAERKVRRGQDFFRKVVDANFEQRCALSGLSVKALLVASHIVPWSKDENRRCDPANGLLLSALLDKAFDIGLISFSRELETLVSPKLGSVNNDPYLEPSILHFAGTRLRQEVKTRIDPGTLDFHRENIFKS